jgi:hypothetical protein
MARRVFASLVALVALPAIAPAQEAGPDLSLPTPAEAVGYLAFTEVDEVVPYLASVAAEVGGLELDTLAILNGGVSGAVPIPVVRLPATSAVGDSPVVRVLVLGSQHGTERAGLEVSLRLVRDLAGGELSGLRQALDIRIIPMTNPLGVLRRTRGGAGGVDLNRDHVALAAAETRAIWAEAAEWSPHLVLDLHELGPSVYDIQIGVPTNPAVHPDLSTFARFYILPQVANRLARSDIPFHEYVSAESLDGSDDNRYYTPPPLEAGNARNAFGLAGAASFLIEAASSRDILGLEERTEQMYVASTAFLEAAVLLAEGLVAVSAAARERPDGALPIAARYVARSPAAQQPWITINERGLRARTALRPWLSVVQVDAEISIPPGWLIEGRGGRLASTLRGHGFDVRRLESATTYEIQTYAVCPEEPNDGLLVETTRRRFPAGTWYVPSDQPGARLLFTMIEPWSQEGWFGGDGPDCSDSYPVYRTVE